MSADVEQKRALVVATEHYAEEIKNWLEKLGIVTELLVAAGFDEAVEQIEKLAKTFQLAVLEGRFENGQSALGLEPILLREYPQLAIVLLSAGFSNQQIAEGNRSGRRLLAKQSVGQQTFSDTVEAVLQERQTSHFTTVEELVAACGSLEDGESMWFTFEGRLPVPEATTSLTLKFFSNVYHWN